MLPLLLLVVLAGTVTLAVTLTKDGQSTAGSSSTSPRVTSDTAGPTTTEGQAITPDLARQLGANELGQVPVLMYHKIGQGIVPPERLREDIALLKGAGFYPTTVREMAEGTMDIPAGKSPVVLTFDDSSPTHYRILDDGSLDPDCAVAILQAAVAAGDWAPKATFFPLLYVDPPANILFGQPEYVQQKLRNLVEWGYEIGSHGSTHQDLSVASATLIAKELAKSQEQLESLIGAAYEVSTLSPPYGEYPDDRSVLAAGEYEGIAYRYSAVVMAWGESAPSPFSSKFDPLRIPRITAYPKTTVRELVAHFQSHPELRFVSDGDPETVSFPADPAVALAELRTDLEQKVVQY